MSFAFKISSFNRKRKWRIFLDLMKPSSSMKILDVGFTEREYGDTMNYIEKHYQYQDKITALGVIEPVEFKKRYPKVHAVKYDGGRFPFADKEFDICWSNAVIEHVGDREKQLSFLKEISRTSRRAFITTPNRLFPIEVHTKTPLLHFLPKSIFHTYLRMIGKKWATGNYMNLLAFRDLKSLLQDAGISWYKIVRNRLMLFTMDFILVFGDK
jgi:SAM-dependent methyltransferase